MKSCGFKQLLCFFKKGGDSNPHKKQTFKNQPPSFFELRKAQTFSEFKGVAAGLIRMDGGNISDVIIILSEKQFPNSKEMKLKRLYEIKLRKALGYLPANRGYAKAWGG